MKSTITPDGMEVKSADTDSLNPFIIQMISDCVKITGKNSEDIIAVILTGSFSRNEGSVLVESSGKILVLGDIEFIVVTRRDTDFRKISTLLQNEEKKAERILKERSISCKIEFSPVARGFLKRAKPIIFNYELFLNGKVIYGDPGILSEMPVFKASQIPKYDAFFLLCNRIVEQLSFFNKLSARTLTGVDAYYPLVKLYMDMAGSFLILTGRYEPSYFIRHQTFSKLPADGTFLTGKSFPSFLKRLGKMTDFKINPGEMITQKMSNGQLQGLFYESIGYAQQLWPWAIDFLAKGGVRKSLDESCSTILESFPLKARIRGWLKFLWIAWKIKEPLSFFKILKLFFLGPPQMLIYCAAAQLYFNLGQESGCDVKKVTGFLPIKADASNEKEAIDAVVDAWTKFVRSV